jgi:hypothetical protein
MNTNFRLDHIASRSPHNPEINPSNYCSLRSCAEKLTRKSYENEESRRKLIENIDKSCDETLEVLRKITDLANQSKVVPSPPPEKWPL